MAGSQQKIGFIGGGAMAEAIIASIMGSDMGFSASSLYVAEKRAARRAELKEKYGLNVCERATDFLPELDALWLCVKPKDAEGAMRGIASSAPPDMLVASIVAGLPIADIEKHFDRQPVIRIMPNTPLTVGEGMSAFALGSRATAEIAAPVKAVLTAGGKAVEMPEPLLDAVTGLSGSAPAFAFLIIDALADGGVAAGLPRREAITMAAQTLLGAAKMVLVTGRHPDDLRDQVASPAGTTIAGLRVLEQRGVRGALLDAVLAAAEKSAALRK